MSTLYERRAMSGGMDAFLMARRTEVEEATIWALFDFRELQGASSGFYQQRRSIS